MQLSSLTEYGKVSLHCLVEAVQAIPISKWSSRSDPESYETCVIRENNPAFPKDEILSVLDGIAPLLGAGYQNRIVLSCVPAGKEILLHTDDFGELVRGASIHCHIPLITENSVIMGIDGEEHHLKEGFLYSMDETKPHYVKNPSGVDRVHLLFAHFPH
jgi:hypothetical protein